MIGWTVRAVICFEGGSQDGGMEEDHGEAEMIGKRRKLGWCGEGRRSSKKGNIWRDKR